MNISELVTTFDSKRWKKLGHWKKSFMLDWIEATSLSLQHFQPTGLEWRIDNYAFVAHTAMMGEDDYTSTKRYYEGRLTSRHDFAFEYGQKCYQLGNDLIQFSRSLSANTTWREASREDLSRYLDTFVSMVSSNIPFFPPLVALEEVLDERIRFLLANCLEVQDVSPIHLFDYLNTFSAPRRTPEMIEKRELLLSIGANIQSDKHIADLFTENAAATVCEVLPTKRPDLWEELGRYVRTYGWLSTFGWLGVPLSELSAIEEIQDILHSDCSAQVRTLHSDREKAEQAIETAILQLQPSEELLHLIDIIREYAYLRLFRIDVYNKAYFYAAPLFREIGARLALSEDELLFLTPPETARLLASPTADASPLVRSRQRGFTILRLSGEVSILAGDAFTSFEQSRQKEDYGELKAVKGDPVFKGTVAGPAKVVMDSSELYKVNRGDVLVAPMTNPDFTAVFGKIAGIITDEGGVLCHAAIVAREYKLPCIIATKIATKVFLDDDFVFLDATSGIATKGARAAQPNLSIEPTPQFSPVRLFVVDKEPELRIDEGQVSWLGDDSSQLSLAVGSKFRNLAILHRNGFRIPAAFCIRTSAFGSFLTENGLSETINDKLGRMNFESSDVVRTLSSEIQTLIVNGKISPALNRAVEQSLSELGGRALSVRSSSTAEDLALASFAGVYESFLNVIGLDNVVQKIKACWASAFSERALYYYYEQVRQGRLSEPHIGVAVIVQALIEAEKSGICFTANPESLRSDEIVIQAAYGLGEGAVSGEVAADVYVIAKATGQVVTRSFAETYTAIVPETAGGVREISVTKPIAGTPLLSGEELAEIWRVSVAIEGLFGSAQDIEWANDRHQGLFVLQSRPITTVPADRV